MKVEEWRLLYEGCNLALIEAIEREHALQADNARLRGLIKRVETSGNLKSSGECPWCEEFVPNYQQGHAADCAAFTPDGSVK